MMNHGLSNAALDQLFREARTHNGWLPREVQDLLLAQVYDLARMGPTSANCSPLRVLFVKSPEAKERLKACLAPGNIEKTMTAPVTAVFAWDTQFYELLPRLFPHTDARSWFLGNPDLIHETAFRNSTLSAAYFILAARALGLDCGPMSGFDREKCDQAFFPDGRFRSNFLCNLGYGDPAKLFPRGPRLSFAEACRIL